MARPKQDRVERPHFGPCSEKQRLILLDDTTDILLCGGGAGGGKSRTCLTKALKYINDPEARVMIVRRTFPQLKLSGGLIDESKSIYKWFGGKFNIQTSTWTFRNGATIQFAPIPQDATEWQGAQVSHFLVDEAAEFTQEEILFLISRLRRVEYKGHLSIILTCNPWRESFLYQWVEFSLDPDTGIPVPGTENRIRWFINIGGKMIWADSVEELWEENHKEYYLNRDPAKGRVNFIPKSFRFIPLTVYDNPILLEKNPGYLANLLSQPRVNQMRYLYGSWTARPEGDGYFRREWIEIVDHPPVNAVSRVRSWDLAASEKTEANPNPDWTAGVKMSRDKYGIYYIEDCRRFRKTVENVIKDIVDTALRDGVDECNVTIPKDPGAGGKAANSFYIRTLAENGIAARSIQISGHTGKVKNFLPFCSLAQNGSVKIVRGPWNDDYLTELEFFTGDRNQKDDQVDATSDAFNTLSKQIQLPTFAVPNMDRASLVPIVR